MRALTSGGTRVANRKLAADNAWCNRKLACSQRAFIVAAKAVGRRIEAAADGVVDRHEILSA